MTQTEAPSYVDYSEYYDFAHFQKDDIPFFLDYARECGSPLLELACGTGRLIVPIAEAGYNITGIDLSAKMLSICRERVNRLGLSDRVSLVEANMTNFDLPEKQFALAYVPLRSFTHLFTQKDQLSCLHTTFAHLRPGGLFIVVVFALNFSVLAKDSEDSFRVLREFDLPDGNHVVQSQRFAKHDRAKQILYFEFKFEEKDRNGLMVRERTVPMDMRYTLRYELQLLMERAGFEVVDVFQDYEKRPFSGKYEIIMVGRKPNEK
ncbi:methyltransferase domain-containing protein [Candidatus Sumerlaeota bacterium]|nr:methyltransferase domain-containing protein [Candidatus Sumerlaeota bacterium]